MSKKSHPPFDKYKYYTESVQSPEADVEFFEQVWSELRPHKKLITLREDFCGTFIVCCQWVKSKNYRKAIGIDIDPLPIAYGHKTHYSQLTQSQKRRVNTFCMNVLSAQTPFADMVVATNFSFFLFKERQTLLKYFSLVYKKLQPQGLFVLDCFGGPDCYEPNEEETPHKGFSYFWDQATFDPISHQGQFYIHFHLKGERKRLKVFSYNWRVWTIPEMKDILQDAGFAKSHIYWEGTTKDGEGNGQFQRTEKGENCKAWVAYLVAEK